MARGFLGILALLVGWCIGTSSVTAKECGPLKMLASVKLVQPSENKELIPVTVNGSPRQFLLDTGGVFTQIAPSAAEALHLKLETGALPVFDVSGNRSGAFVKLDSFSLGGMTGNNLYVRVSPTNSLDADGIIAPDILKHYDVEMDFAGGKLNYFLPDHCPGKVIYWPHADAAQVPLLLGDPNYFEVQVTLDGKLFLAVIDTGATRTTISTETALESFDLTPDSPGMERAGNVNNESNLPAYLHTFSTLSLNGITVKNPRVAIIPDRLADIAAPQHQTMGLPDLILGMDVLKHLHLYFAFDEHNLYVTAADAPSTGTTTPQ